MVAMARGSVADRAEDLEAVGGLETAVEAVDLDRLLLEAAG